MNIKAPDHRHERLKKWAVILGVLAFIAATGWNVATRISVQKANSASLDQVVSTIEDACQNRHALTVQYQVRAKNQRVLARTQLLTTGALLSAIAEGPQPPTDASQEELEIRAKFLRRYKAAVPKLKHILHTTKILPLENCKRQGAELRADLPSG